MHNKYKIERATPQFDRRGSTTTIETSFNVSPENIQPKLDSVDLKSVKANPNIKSSSGMENVEANHLSSVAVTSNNLPKFPNTPSLNLGVPDAGEPNHGYVSVFYNAAGAGGRKPSMPISRALVSTEDKTGAGADYPDSAPYSGSGILNKNKYGTSDASKEGSGRKTTISENGSASGNNGGGNGAMSIEDVYKKLKSMMILMVGIIGFLIVLFLLMIVIFAALIASTNSKMENLENENTEQKAKIEELELKIQNSSNEDLLNQIGGFNSSLFQMNGTIKDIRLEVDTLTTNMDDIQDFEIPLMKIDIANSKTNIENLKTRVTQLEDFHA